jgi:hypothetical protein
MSNDSFIKFGVVVTRLKTKRKIKIDFEGDEPEQIISRVKLEHGEILQDVTGLKFKVLYPDTLTENWDQRIYNVEIIKA